MHLTQYKTQPYAHQLKCIEQFGHHPYYALLGEMGTGKTWIMINEFSQHWRNGNCDAVFILAPNGVHANWINVELPNHTPYDVRRSGAIWRGNRRVCDQKVIDNVCKPSERLRILAMNWEALATRNGFNTAMSFCKSAKNLMIIADESDAIKNPKPKRTKALLKLAPLARWRRIMSGTPINNSPFDCYTQFNFLSPDIFKMSYPQFQKRYAHFLSQTHPLVKSIKDRTNARAPLILAKDDNGRVKYQNLDELSQTISQYSFRILKKDCLDLPDKIYKTFIYDLTKMQRSIYTKAEQDLRLELADGIKTFSKLTSITKLAQICGGFYFAKQAVKDYFPPRFETIVCELDDANPKLELLVELLKQIIKQANSQVIIFTKFTHEITMIRAALVKLAVTHVEYHGDVNTDDRVKSIDTFQAHNAKVFLANTQSCATGLTLTAADYVIYYSNSFSLRDRLQSEDRAHRIGQTKNVTYIDLVGRYTIEERIVKALLNKQELANLVIDQSVLES